MSEIPFKQLFGRSKQFQKVRLGNVLAKAIAAALLFGALGRHDYDYYTLLRWIACGVCAFTAFQAAEAKKFGWLWIFAITAIILNPVAPLHLKRETWNTVDTAAGVLLLVAIVIFDIRKPPPTPPPVSAVSQNQPVRVE